MNFVMGVILHRYATGPVLPPTTTAVF